MENNRPKHIESKRGRNPAHGPLVDVLRRINHELGHHGETHTEKGYHDPLCKLGAELVAAALGGPRFFEFGGDLNAKEGLQKAQAGASS